MFPLTVQAVKKLRPISLSPNFVWSMAGLGLTVMLAFFVWIAYGLKEATLAVVQKQVENIAALVAQEVARDVELYGLSLEAVLDGIRDSDVMKLPPRLRQLTLFDRSTTAQGLGALVVLDAAGNITLDSRSYPPRKGNFADREYFRRQREAAPQSGLYFSRPFNARLQGRAWSMSVSRRLSGPDGSFAGIVHVTVNLDYLRRQFEKVLLGSQGLISLFRTDGILLTRTLDTDLQVGKDWHQLPLFKHLKGADIGAFRTYAAMDGISRTYAFRRISGLPLVVAVGESDAEALSPWRAKIGMLAVIYILMASSVLFLTALLVGELRRRETAERLEARRARLDGLTGLVNRRGFDESFADEWQRAAQECKCLAIIMIDVDQFKDFNDEYGHPEGDRILKAIADAIGDIATRPADVVARYGGEEIAVLLPETEQQGALAVAERIVASVQALKIPHRRGTHGFVTVSAGLATLTSASGATPDQLIRLADNALYYAKNTGRNKASVSNVAAFRTPATPARTEGAGSAVA